MSKRPLAVLGIVLVGYGCVTTEMDMYRVEYQFNDHPDQARIELIFENRTDKKLCLSSDAWPSEAGKLDQMNDRVFMLIANERFPIAYFEEYCPKGCYTSVSAGEKIIRSIPYSEFNIPERLRYESKTLEFQPQAFVCR